MSRTGGGEPVPRAAIAGDGTSAVAFRAQSGALLVATGTGNGRFGVPRIVDRKGSGDHSIAAAPRHAARQDAPRERVRAWTGPPIALSRPRW